MEEQKTLKKDKECIRCERFFDCDGKPVGTHECIRFKERKSEDG